MHRRGCKVNGYSYSLQTGDIFWLKYAETPKPVRIIGFKHDELTDKEKKGDYAGLTYAGITFDFVEFMTGTTYYQMNTSNTNIGGWAATSIRKTLNGYTTTATNQSGAIGGLGANLSNKAYIKQVKKTYGTQYNSNTTSTSQDYLWLLSCAEIWSSGFSGGYGLSAAKEGNQYAWYKANEVSYGNNNLKLAKKANTSSSNTYWWLRSSFAGTSDSPGSSSYCVVGVEGGIGAMEANKKFGIAPGFCI